MMTHPISYHAHACRLSALIIFVLCGQGSLRAQSSVYWDNNGATAGAGGSAPVGVWNGENAFWNTDADGLAGTLSAWTAGNIAVFSAGADSTGAYTIGVTGSQDIRGLTFEDGEVTLQGGALNLTGAGTFNVAETLVATLNGVSLTGDYGLTKQGKGTLRLTGATTSSYTGDFRLGSGTVELATTGGNALGSGHIQVESTAGGSSNINPVTLRLLAADQISDSAQVTVLSQQFRAALFDLNGFQETIGGLTVVGRTGTNNVGVMIGAGGVLTVAGDIFLHNDRGGSTGNNVRDVLITGTGSRSSAQPNSGVLDLASGVRTITVQGRAATLYGNDDATIETTIRNGGILKAGGQKLILLGTNIYEGGTTISEGTLQLGIGGSTGSIIGDVVNNAVLEFNRSNAYAFAGDISGTGVVNKLGAGVLTLSGTNAYAGLTSVLNGSLEVHMLGMGGSVTGTNVGTLATIHLGAEAANVGLIYTGAGETTDKVLRLTGTTGNVTLTASGTGAVVFQSAMDVSEAGDKTLILAGTNPDANTLMGGITDATGGGVTSLLKTGAGTWALGGVNTYTGSTTVDGGTLRLTGAGSIPQEALIVRNGTFDIAGDLDLTLTGDPDLKIAPAELISYGLFFGGGSAGSAGTVNMTAGRSLILGSHVAYTATGNNLGSNITGGTLNIGNVERYFVVNNSSNAEPELTVSSTVIGGTGSLLTKAGNGTLALNGGLAVDGVRVNTGRLDFGGAMNVIRNSLQVGFNNISSATYATAGGELFVGSGSADTLDVGVTINAQTYAYATPSGTLDLRGSESLTVNVGRVRVGVHTSASGAVFSVPADPSLNGLASPSGMTPNLNFLYLPTHSQITASTHFVVGDAASASVGTAADAHWVEFGEGESLVKTPQMYIGWRKGSGTGTIREGGTLTLQGVNEGASAALFIGYNAVNTSGATISRLDLSEGTFVAQLSSVTIGWKSSGSSVGGSSTGSLILGSSSGNAVDVSGTVVVGNLGGTQASPITSFGRGTLSLSGGSFTVGGNVELAKMTFVSGAVTNANLRSEGTLNLTGGTFRINGNLITTADTLNRNTATVNLDGGTLDMTDGSIGAADALVVFNAHSGGLRGLAEYNGGVPLVKATAGLLTLGGLNSYTGGTVINGGTLEVLSSSRTGLGNTTVNGAGAVLAGEGTVSANTVLTLGNIRPGENGGVGNGMLTFANDLTLNAAPGSGSTLQLGIAGATGIADLGVYEVAQIPSVYDFTSYNTETHNLGDHDLLRVQGALTWNEGTRLVVEDEGVNYAYGQVFNLLDWTGLLGGGPTFTSTASDGGVVNDYLTLPSLTGTGFFWDLSLFSDHGVLVVVPEPGRAVLMLLGLGLVGMRRRR